MRRNVKETFLLQMRMNSLQNVTRCEKKSLETRDLDTSVAIGFASVSHRARRWVSAATQDLAYAL